MEENRLKYNINSSFLKLKKYCEDENFKGWDPYDGLNSKIFNLTPFKNWDLARLIWIQGFKLSPLNFRNLLLVPKDYNAKGIALFLLGYCNLYEIIENGNKDFGLKENILSKINLLANLLCNLKSDGSSGASWGYNFGWQARKLFYFPKNTPTVVATSFCVEALFKAYEITKNENYKNLALTSSNFILNDLNRTSYKSGFLFSYSNINGNNTVLNASLLGVKTLSICYKYSKNEIYKEQAKQAVVAACSAQSSDGSWVYGLLPIQSWIDSFHTGYNLDAISTYQKFCNDFDFKKNIDDGFQFYIKKFFTHDGIPKYYHNKTYPIDIHCPGQLFVTLSKLDKFKTYEKLADKVMLWTINNMQSDKGYFYYQLRRFFSSKISFMRWSNAFMFNSMVYYFKEKSK